MKMNLPANTKAPLLTIGLIFLTIALVQAQKFRYSIPGLDSLEQSFILNGTSSTVLQNGQAEIIWNNTLASYQLALHESSTNSPILDRFRQTQFLSDFYGFYGISPSGRWDLGLQMRYVRTRTDNAATSSMFRVFQSQKGDLNSNDPGNPTTILDNSFGGLANIGLRFRFKPIRRHPPLVINGGYAFSIIKDEQKQSLLLADRDYADIGATYYLELNRTTYFFFGASGFVYFPSQVRDEFLFRTNLSYSVIMRTNNNKFTFYPSLSYGLDFKPSKFDDRALIRTVDYLFAYASVQYIPSSKFNIFLTAGLPLIIDLKNPQQEIIRNSYSILALGCRIGIL